MKERIVNDPDSPLLPTLPSRIHRLSNVSKSSVSVRKYESAAAKWKTEIRNMLAEIAIIEARINIRVVTTMTSRLDFRPTNRRNRDR